MNVQLPQDLTGEEEDLGFQLQEIDNPDGRAVSPPVRARAVVFQVEDWERVVKVQGAGGRAAYQRQVHGVWKPTVDGDVPTWKAVGEHADPRTAVAPEARQTAGMEGRTVVPSPPAMTRDHAT